MDKHNCPVCGTVWEASPVCPQCGWDGSADPELYPTLFPAAGKPSRAARSAILRTAATGTEEDRMYAALGRLAFSGIGREPLQACLSSPDPAGTMPELLYAALGMRLFPGRREILPTLPEAEAPVPETTAPPIREAAPPTREAAPEQQPRERNRLRSRAFADRDRFGGTEHIRFRNSLQYVPENAFDLSEAGDGSVMGHLRQEAGRLTLTVCGEGGVLAPESCSALFAYLPELRSMDFGGCFHTEGVTDMQGMFSGCGKLGSLDLRYFDTSGVTAMNEMFSACRSLRFLELSSFDTAKVTGMRRMFADCSVLEVLDLRSFNTAYVTDMSRMFRGCAALRTLNVSSFNTAWVTDMSEMFSGCSALKDLDLSGFRTDRVASMQFMFSGCDNLTERSVRSLRIPRNCNTSGMLYGVLSMNRR